MSEVEIHYLVPDAKRRQNDVEQIIAAIGSYQDEIPFNVVHTATISQEANNSVFLSLAKTTKWRGAKYELLEEAERMRRGVESYFNEEARNRLSKLFAGIALDDVLDIE